MAVDLASLIAPGHTAVVTMEIQRAVVGDLAGLPQLAEAARAVGSVTNAGRVCAAARQAGVRVVHSTAVFRPDRAGSAVNSPLQAASARLNQHRLDVGDAGSELVPELQAAEADIVVPRLHGLTPFLGTELDPVLRNLGISTVVAVGHSVNVGLTGLVLNAVDLGYSVVVPRDAVVGVPLDYCDAVIANTLSLLAAITTTDELVGLWQGRPAEAAPAPGASS